MTAEPISIGHKSPVRHSEKNGTALVDLAPFGMPGFFEHLVLAQSGPNAFEVRCIPFCAYGFSLGDEVALNSEMFVERVVSRKGNRTLRAMLVPSMEDDAAAETFRAEVDRRASALGLLYEWNGWGNVAIDVPAGTSDSEIAAVIEFIGGHVDRGLAFWEWSETLPFEPPVSPWPWPLV
ncbi:DUF4265 domain-containing protein [Lentzea sp. NPDC092896]|uniref:DUF4265 domain-containing protein n=1 Tax=Lentzea sp. NPDC092896 TaxID=3364127 RepID=UPI0037F1E52B